MLNDQKLSFVASSFAPGDVFTLLAFKILPELKLYKARQLLEQARLDQSGVQAVDLHIRTFQTLSHFLRKNDMMPFSERLSIFLSGRRLRKTKLVNPRASNLLEIAIPILGICNYNYFFNVITPLHQIK